MNWFKKSQAQSMPAPDHITASILYDERTFYNRFTQDLLEAKEEVVIESPFITIPRLKIFIITKNPDEQELGMSEHSEAGIAYFEGLGAQVLLCEGHHRKLAMIDKNVLWEGSLNILSQTHSREFMRRIESKKLTQEMFKFLKYDKVEFFKK